jgi:hypothetical protein
MRKNGVISMSDTDSDTTKEGYRNTAIKMMIGGILLCIAGLIIGLHLNELGFLLFGGGIIVYLTNRK